MGDAYEEVAARGNVGVWLLRTARGRVITTSPYRDAGVAWNKSACGWRDLGEFEVDAGVHSRSHLGVSVRSRWNGVSCNEGEKSVGGRQFK